MYCHRQNLLFSLQEAYHKSAAKEVVDNQLPTMATDLGAPGSVVKDFDPDNFANASTIASWLESLPDSEKLQCVQALSSQETCTS